jgi:hypothetical protein
MTTFTLTPDHAFIFPVAIFCWFINQFLGARVGSARNKYGIKYPHLYASPALENFVDKKTGVINYELYNDAGIKFNNVQRGHQHLFEGNSEAYFLMVLSWIFFPREAAVGGFLFALGSLVYGLGYAISPDKRFLGEAIYFPGFLIWFYCCGKTGYGLYNGTL